MACVVQWFESKKNCPQCRHPAREGTLRKIFLAETDSGAGPEDVGSLTNQLDSVKFQLRLKENEKNKLSARNKELEEQSKKQKEEMKNLEQAKSQLRAQYEGMRNQARVLQGEKIKFEEAVREKEELKHKLANYKGVEIALRGQEGALNDFLNERAAFDPRTKDLAILVISLKQKLAEVKRERGKTDNILKDVERQAGIEKKRVKELEDQVGDLQAISRNYESDLKTSRKECEQLKKTLQAAKESVKIKQSEPVPTISNNDNVLESMDLLDEMEDFEDEEEEEEENSGTHRLPTFTTAGTDVKPVEQNADTPPLSSCNILTRRPLDQLRGQGSLSQQYDGLGGRARDLFSAQPPRPPGMKIKPTTSSQPSMKRKKLPSFGKTPVSKQMKTMDKFFGSFDTP